MKESKEDLEQMHKLNEEERERLQARRAGVKRMGSVETEGGESPMVRGQVSHKLNPRVFLAQKPY